MKLTVAPSVAASSSAPFLTACQNWCWKPFETIEMYGLLAGALWVACVAAEELHAEAASTATAARLSNLFI